MKTILSFAVYFGVKISLFLLINASLIGSGLAIGLVLHELIPSVDMGAGTLIGLVSLVVSYKCYSAAAKEIRAALDERKKIHEMENSFSRMEKHLRSGSRIKKNR